MPGVQPRGERRKLAWPAGPCLGGHAGAFPRRRVCKNSLPKTPSPPHRQALSNGSVRRGSCSCSFCAVRGGIRVPFAGPASAHAVSRAARRAKLEPNRPSYSDMRPAGPNVTRVCAEIANLHPPGIYSFRTWRRATFCHGTQLRSVRWRAKRASRRRRGALKMAGMSYRSAAGSKARYFALPGVALWRGGNVSLLHTQHSPPCLKDGLCNLSSRRSGNEQNRNVCQTLGMAVAMTPEVHLCCDDTLGKRQKQLDRRNCARFRRERRGPRFYGKPRKKRRRKGRVSSMTGTAHVFLPLCSAFIKAQMAVTHVAFVCSALMT